MRSIARLLHRRHGIASTIRARVAPCRQPLVARRTFATAATAPTSGTKTTNHDGSTRRRGDDYILTKEEVESYHRDGYLLAPGIVSEAELKEIEKIYSMFMDRMIHVPGKDFCDMSQPLSTPWEEYKLVNAMLPRKYYPPLRDNIYERRTASLARQLFPGVEMVLDYDQLLAKKPSKTDAKFAWHCDLAYWPVTPHPQTATFSLAVDPSTPANGCLKVLVGSHHDKELRRHYPMGNAKTREESHTLVTDVDEATEPIHTLSVPRGGFTIHNERIAHASGGNTTQGWRRTYVIAYRTRATVDWERAHGFTHSHNDTFNWDQFHKWQAKQ